MLAALAVCSGLGISFPADLVAVRGGVAGPQARPLPLPGWRLEPAAPEGLADRRAQGAFVAPLRGTEVPGGWSAATADLLLLAHPGQTERAAERVRARLPEAELELGFGGLAQALRVCGAARDGWQSEALAAELSNWSELALALPDRLVSGRACAAPQDPLFEAAWHRHNHGQAGGVSGIDVDALHALGLGGGDATSKVLVLDDGVQLDHPDLPHVVGADFTGQGGAGAPVEACDRHGTALAGLISASVDNGLGSSGIAPACRVLSARVLARLPSCDGSFVALESALVAALDWGLAQGARVTLNANVFATVLPLADAKYAATHAFTQLHVAAVGNDGAAAIGWPAASPSVWGIGAIDRHGAHWPLSNTGSEVDLVAPGVAVPTTDRSGAVGYTSGDDVVLDGTSLAAAQVAGAAALVLARRPNLSLALLESSLIAGAQDLGVSGADAVYGQGLLRCRAPLLTTSPFGATQRVTQSALGVQQDSDAYFPSISYDGRWIAFDSTASNLVPGDSNGLIDGFLVDRWNGTVARITVSSLGAQANDTAGDVFISGDASAIAFDSLASNLVPLDLNGTVDTFVHVRATGVTERVSVDSAGVEGNGPSFIPSLSADARHVAFRSKATNLTAGDTNAKDDCFVRDRLLGTTERVSVSSSGVQGNGHSNEPELSGDGRYVVFQSHAANFDGLDANGLADLYLRDRLLATTVLVSRTPAGSAGNGESINAVISHDGARIAFESSAEDLAPDGNGLRDAFVWERATGLCARVSKGVGGAQPNGDSYLACISPDGRWVGFYSDASNLVVGDTNGQTDFFVVDLTTGSLQRESVSSGGAQGSATAGGGATFAGLSWGARVAVFESQHSNLVPLDLNSSRDIFARERAAGADWLEVGFGLTGAAGEPRLVDLGGFGPGLATRYELTAAAPNSVGALVLGVTRLDLPLFGGVLVPGPDVLKAFFTTAGGTAVVPQPWPATLPAGLSAWAQAWVLDAAAAQGFAASNALATRSY